LQENLYLPNKYDFLAEGKKVILAEVMATSYRKFLARNEPTPVFATVKAARTREKASTACHVVAKDLSGHLLNRK
jgi:hypothetical protein